MAHWSGIGIPKTNAIALEVSYTQQQQSHKQQQLHFMDTFRDIPESLDTSFKHLQQQTKNQMLHEICTTESESITTTKIHSNDRYNRKQQILLQPSVSAAAATTTASYAAPEKIKVSNMKGTEMNIAAAAAIAAATSKQQRKAKESAKEEEQAERKNKLSNCNTINTKTSINSIISVPSEKEKKSSLASIKQKQKKKKSSFLPHFASMSQPAMTTTTATTATATATTMRTAGAPLLQMTSKTKKNFFSLTPTPPPTKSIPTTTTNTNTNTNTTHHSHTSLSINGAIMNSNDWNFVLKHLKTKDAHILSKKMNNQTSFGKVMHTPTPTASSITTATAVAATAAAATQPLSNANPVKDRPTMTVLPKETSTKIPSVADVSAEQTIIRHPNADSLRGAAAACSSSLFRSSIVSDETNTSSESLRLPLKSAKAFDSMMIEEERAEKQQLERVFQQHTQLAVEAETATAQAHAWHNVDEEWSKSDQKLHSALRELRASFQMLASQKNRKERLHKMEQPQRIVTAEKTILVESIESVKSDKKVQTDLSSSSVVIPAPLSGTVEQTKQLWQKVYYQDVPVTNTPRRTEFGTMMPSWKDDTILSISPDHKGIGSTDSTVTLNVDDDKTYCVELLQELEEAATLLSSNTEPFLPMTMSTPTPEGMDVSTVADESNRSRGSHGETNALPTFSREVLVEEMNDTEISRNRKLEIEQEESKKAAEETVYLTKQSQQADAWQKVEESMNDSDRQIIIALEEMKDSWKKFADSKVKIGSTKDADAGLSTEENCIEETNSDSPAQLESTMSFGQNVNNKEEMMTSHSFENLRPPFRNFSRSSFQPDMDVAMEDKNQKVPIEDNTGPNELVAKALSPTSAGQEVDMSQGLTPQSILPLSRVESSTFTENQRQGIESKIDPAIDSDATGYQAEMELVNVLDNMAALGAEAEVQLNQITWESQQAASEQNVLSDRLKANENIKFALEALGDTWESLVDLEASWSDAALVDKSTLLKKSQEFISAVDKHEIIRWHQEDTQSIPDAWACFDRIIHDEDEDILMQLQTMDDSWRRMACLAESVVDNGPLAEECNISGDTPIPTSPDFSTKVERALDFLYETRNSWKRIIAAGGANEDEGKAESDTVIAVPPLEEIVEKNRGSPPAVEGKSNRFEVSSI